MTNDQRRKRIIELKEKLSPLQYEETIVSLRHNFLSNPHRQPLSPEQQQELIDVTRKLDELNEKIKPIFDEMRSIQVKYFVEYDGMVNENGILRTLRNQNEFYLSTDTNIDTYNQGPDFNDTEVWAVINEIKDFIFLYQFSKFTIQGIRRIN
jgi:hypothetical protein